MIIFILLQIALRDGGQAYAETNLSRLIAEPWNFVTAFLFVVIAGYWLFKIKNEIPKFTFLFGMLILLLIGGFGGTIYHGFRWHRAFLMMDWMPVLLITFSSSVWFFMKAWGKWWPPLILLLIYFFIQGVLFNSAVPIQTAINISYASMAAVVLFPVIWFLKKTKFRNARLVFVALVLFALALFFRWADMFIWLPIGTHFLWHIFGLSAVHFMLRFLYAVTKKEQKVLSLQPKQEKDLCH